MKSASRPRTCNVKVVALLLCMMSALPAFAQTSIWDTLGSAVGKALAEYPKGQSGTHPKNSTQTTPSVRETEPYQSPSPANPFLSLLYTECSVEELGRVIKVTSLNSKQTNSLFKKLGAYPAAKPGDTYLQIFVKSKIDPNYYSLTKAPRAPSASESAEMLGKPHCVIAGDA